MMKIKQPTIKDVAFVAGVSTQTVSRVLNKRVDVAEATRERILKIISDLDYSPNEAARYLVRQRSMRTPSYISRDGEITHYA